MSLFGWSRDSESEKYSGSIAVTSAHATDPRCARACLRTLAPSEDALASAKSSAQVRKKCLGKCLSSFVMLGARIDQVLDRAIQP